jgi:hypothetical protein
LGIYVDEKAPPNSRDDGLSFGVVRRGQETYRLLMGDTLRPVRAAGDELIPVDPTFRPKCLDEDPPCTSPTGNFRRGADGKIRAGSHSYRRLPFLSSTSVELVSAQGETYGRRRALIDHGFLILTRQNTTYGNTSCDVGVLLPDAAFTGKPPLTSGSRRAYLVSGAFANEADTKDTCQGVPLSSKTMNVDPDPLGSIVVDERGNPLALVIIGYMYEETFLLPGLSADMTKDILRLAYSAVGMHPGASAE